MFASYRHAVTEDQVRDAIDLGATTVDAVATVTQA